MHAQPLGKFAHACTQVYSVHMGVTAQPCDVFRNRARHACVYSRKSLREHVFSEGGTRTSALIMPGGMGLPLWGSGARSQKKASILLRSPLHLLHNTTPHMRVRAPQSMPTACMLACCLFDSQSSHEDNHLQAVPWAHSFRAWTFTCLALSTCVSHLCVPCVYAMCNPHTCTWSISCHASCKFVTAHAFVEQGQTTTHNHNHRHATGFQVCLSDVSASDKT